MRNMKNKIVFMMTQIIKMTLQHLVLPVVYRFWRIVYVGKKPELIVFADSNHDSIPASMVQIHDTLTSKGYDVVDAFRDCGRSSQLGSLMYAMEFMKLYVQAKVVFICDNFHPVISCHKRKETTVVQLWHACGAYKKFGYATEDDVPKGYIGHMYRNYNLVTVSSPFCVRPFEESMRQKPGVVQALGISRTDAYFDEKWIENCRENFYDMHPEAKGKKVILWAPTFRGNAGNAHQIGLDEMLRLKQQLKEEYYLLIKLHPHVEDKTYPSNFSIVTEQLFPVVDLLITDYSSVLFDFMIFKKPYMLYVPDLKEYTQKRGFYLDIKTLSPYVAENESELISQIESAVKCEDCTWVDEIAEKYVATCDGHATERILEKLKF